MITIKFDTHELAALQRALESVPAEMRGTVLPRALNDTGDKVLTFTKRNLVKITGAKAGRVAKALSRKPAGAGRLEYRVTATDPYMSLKDFSPAQRQRGVSANPWNTRRIFPGTFLGPGGHVFHRLTPKRLPIEKLWGPSIPKEMVREENAEPVKAIIMATLPARVNYWLGRMLATKR